MRISCAHDRRLVLLTGTFMPPFSLHVELDVTLTESFLNSPTLNRPRVTSRALSRKSLNMTCVPSNRCVIVTLTQVYQNKNAGSGGDGEDDEE